MEQHRRIIRICDGKIHLNPTWSMSVDQTNLAEGEVKFRSNVDVYWEIEFNENSFSAGTLHVSVVNYNPSKTEVFNSQNVNDNLHNLDFKGIIWDELNKLLISYKPNPLFNAGIVINDHTINDRKKEAPFKSFENFSTTSFVNPSPKPKTFINYETIAVPYADADFQDQKISFTWSFSWHPSSIRFNIENIWLRKEYDFIKVYFERALNCRQTFSVNVTVIITEGIVTSAVAESHIIKRIDKTIIDSIKYKRVVNLLKAPSTRKERSLFTTDDIFNNFNEDAGNIFEQTGIELLNYLVSYKKVRNEQQLKCLASELHPANYKLRFTLNPFFGFVFYLPGKSYDFFCWELLESHATYLWSFSRNVGLPVDVLYDTVEEQISIIEEIGREQYKRKQRENQSLDYNFISLEHTKINETDQAFENWKRKLDEILLN